MKYLLIIGLVLVVFFLWRHNRQAQNRSAPRQQPGAPAAATEIVACSVCQVHLPKSEALIGSDGIYCSEAHRRQAAG